MAASSGNSSPCYILASQLPGQVSCAQDSTYHASINSYFYQQSRLLPQCIVFPKSASDVSRIVKTIAGLRAKAAIRGGGHTPIANAANLDNAVTIDLSGMNAVSLSTAYSLGLPSSQNGLFSSTGLLSSSAGSNVPASPGSDYNVSSVSTELTDGNSSLSTPNILSAGGGATWGDVYQKLESTGLISVGGRGTSLGVGGLTTGGWSFSNLVPCFQIVKVEVLHRRYFLLLGPQRVCLRQCRQHGGCPCRRFNRQCECFRPSRPFQSSQRGL